MIKMLLDPRVWGVTPFVLMGLGAGGAWGTWLNVCSDCPSIAQIMTFEPEQLVPVVLSCLPRK